MEKIKEIIVVEGKSDINFLSSFLNADFYSVNGSAINEEDILYLKQISTNRGIIILTDPDFPGKKIREYINQNIKNCKNAYISKELSIKHNKVGVAESTKEEILKSLNNLLTFKTSLEKFDKKDLFNLKLSGHKNSKILREKLCNKLNLGFSNSKDLLKKLNSLDNISIEQIKEILDA